MAHFPLNHPLRPLYRALAGLTGTYILIFGCVSLTKTVGETLFARESNWALGLRTNLAFAIVSVIWGLIVLGANLIGGNVGHYINLAGAVVFMVTGIFMLAFMQTAANFLNFSVSTAVLSLIFGVVLLLAGMYDKTGSAESQRAEQAYKSTSIPRTAPRR
ncbi:DUF4383 domain-containing protein [Asanoa sp. WMMD1127]|uniref:DUF4383 domain-containing protein n=1 Tax=Asanoa sp. WMMD1127 TaxID=3016107 RepID=UPI002415CC3E|nr:DUF4383 domain-containing protein [Asanoa sp. WMMD1127]MDG4822746.1 DUF4383 domain-containing protein [Asanoa sp. WMMD1127]